MNDYVKMKIKKDAGRVRLNKTDSISFGTNKHSLAANGLIICFSDFESNGYWAELLNDGILVATVKNIKIVKALLSISEPAQQEG